MPSFGTLRLPGFAKTKITFERVAISGKYNREADGDWENCVRAPGAYFAGG